MKKLLVVLLSLGLIFAFSMTASAQPTVKFGGQYYVVGLYSDNYTFAGDDKGYSRSYFHTRTRLEPVFQIAEGLTFTARMDALEKHWGDYQWRRGLATANPQDTTSSRPSLGVAGANAQQNFEWERAYVTFNTKIGQFQVGYQSTDTFGTAFGDYGTSRPRIFYRVPVGPMTFGLVWDKITEADNTTMASGKVDADGDIYAALGIYNFKGGDAGLLFRYINLNTPRLLAVNPYATKIFQVTPYMKATFGPVYVEAEMLYFFGKTKEYENSVPGGPEDVDTKTLMGYVKAQFNMGPAFFGAQVGYASGNDMYDNVQTEDKQFSGAGSDWNPALILGSDDMVNWSGNMGGGAPGSGQPTLDNNKNNMIMGSIFGGFNVTPDLVIGGALTYAKAASTVRTGWGAAGIDYIDDEYGTELDVTATYKIYNNLSYMVGAGYLWVGDFFKGANPNAKIDNDYLLMNKLTLSF